MGECPHSERNQNDPPRDGPVLGRENQVIEVRFLFASRPWSMFLTPPAQNGARIAADEPEEPDVQRAQVWTCLTPILPPLTKLQARRLFPDARIDTLADFRVRPFGRSLQFRRIPLIPLIPKAHLLGLMPNFLTMVRIVSRSIGFRGKQTHS